MSSCADRVGPGTVQIAADSSSIIGRMIFIDLLGPVIYNARLSMPHPVTPARDRNVPPVLRR
jgi:hypothetical protein